MQKLIDQEKEHLEWLKTQPKTWFIQGLIAESEDFLLHVMPRKVAIQPTIVLSKQSRIDLLSTGETLKLLTCIPSISKLDGKEYMLEPSDWTKVKIGDLVLCKVRGEVCMREVKAIHKKSVEVGTDTHITGNTPKVFGKVTKIFD